MKNYIELITLFNFATSVCHIANLQIIFDWLHSYMLF